MSPSLSISSIKQLETQEEQPFKVLEPEGSSVEEGYYRELEIKSKQQLDGFVKELQYLKLCLGEKQSEFDAVKQALDREKSISGVVESEQLLAVAAIAHGFEEQEVNRRAAS